MTVKKHVTRLQRGAVIWNEWRQEHPDEKIDLSGANLSGANLSGANLSGVDLSRVDLSKANLSGADLSHADLGEAILVLADFSKAILVLADFSKAILWKTNLSGANLSGANLSGADLTIADLSEANLSKADLTSTGFIETNLSGANFYKAEVGYTIFGNLDFRAVKGLETVEHHVQSYISTSTLERSNGEIPSIFLKKAGVGDSMIDYAHSLFRKPFEYYTCFISYSNKDQDFAEQLYANLQSKGVRCWFAPHHMKTGDAIRTRIDETIRQYDKLLLILSQHSVKSEWVKKEVESAFAKESRQKKLVLFPIKLDESVTRTRQAWAADIQNMRHITDFTSWKDHDTYKKSLEKLLNDLQASEAKKHR